MFIVNRLLLAAAIGLGALLATPSNAQTVSSLSLSSSTVAGGTAVNGTVTLSSAAPSQGLLVRLASSQWFATVPPNVTVPSGANSATFPVLSVAVPAVSKASISGSVGSSSQSAMLTLNPPPAPALVLTRPRVLGGMTCTGTILLQHPASIGGLRVQITSRNFFAAVPQSILVPQGASSATFKIATIPVKTGESTTITASGIHSAALVIAPSGYQPYAPWPKLGGNPCNTGGGFKNSYGGTLRWTATRSNPSGSPAIAADGTVYTGVTDNLGFYAYKPGGAYKWSYNLGAPVAGAPAIAVDGTVYIGDNAGFLTALKPDGTLKWNVFLGGLVTNSPVIGTDGSIYAGQSSAASASGRFYKVSSSGNILASIVFKAAVHSTAAIGLDGSIYIGCDDHSLYCLQPNLAIRWKFATNDVVGGAPTVADDGTILFGSLDSRLYALNADGSLKWSYLAGGGIVTGVATGIDGAYYFGSLDGKFYSVSPSGQLLWTFTTGGPLFSTPAVAPDGTIFFGSNDSTLYALNPTGSLAWSYATGGPIQSSPSIGNDSAVTFSSNDNKVYSLGITPTWSGPTGDAQNTGSAFGYGCVGSIDAGIDDSASSVYPSIADGKGRIGYLSVWFTQWDHTDLEFLDGQTFLNSQFLGAASLSSYPGEGSDGSLYFTFESQIGLSSQNFLAALDPSGNFEWVVPLNDQAGSLLGLAPVVAPDGTVYVQRGYHLVAVDPSGKVKWTFGDIFASSLNRDEYFGCYPALGADGTVYEGSDGNHFYAINPITGKANWSLDLGGAIRSNAAIQRDGTIVVGADSKFVYAISPLGSVNWKIPIATYALTAGIGKDDSLYEIVANQLQALDPATGKTLWTFSSTDTLFSPIVASDGTVYLPGLNSIQAVRNGQSIWSIQRGGGYVLDMNGSLYGSINVNLGGSSIFAIR